MWFYLSLGTALGWGIGNVLFKKGYSIFSPGQIYLINGVVFLLIWQVFGYLGRQAFNWPAQISLVFRPAIPALAFLVYITAIQRGRVSIISAISAASILISASLGVIFFQETLKPAGFILIILMVIAIASLQINQSSRQAADGGSLKSEIVWGSLSALAFAVANTITKSALTTQSPIAFSTLNAGWIIIFGLLWLGVKGEGFNLKRFRNRLGVKVLGGSLIYNLGSLFFFLALQNGPLSLVVPLTNLFIPISLMLAVIFLKEKTTWLQKAAIITIFGCSSLIIAV